MDTSAAPPAMDATDPAWDETLGRRRCVRVKRDGERCLKRPVEGTTVCASHGAGKGSPVRRAADAKVEQARLERVARTFGTPVQVGVLEGLLAEWYRSNGVVAWLAAEVAELERDDLTSQSVTGVEQEHALITMLREERKHLVSLGTQMARLGLEERQLKLAENQGQLLGQAFAALLGSPELGLSAGQRATAGRLLREQLVALTAGR